MPTNKIPCQSCVDGFEEIKCPDGETEYTVCRFCGGAGSIDERDLIAEEREKDQQIRLEMGGAA